MIDTPLNGGGVDEEVTIHRRFPSELKHTRQIEGEDLRLKKLVADLSLDKAMPEDVLVKINDGLGLTNPLRGQ
ncbi:TPA: hypothetical protein ND482_004634 [Citrobacter farmeri]|nr:hypothetical protein [Citrobacter farmeri]